MDADVFFESTYFEELKKLAVADLYLFPAVLKATNPIHHLFEIDLLLINALNTGLNGLSRPIIASGANLLFKREAFLKFDRFETHKHIPSGDDIYLLRDFRDAKADVRLVAKNHFKWKRKLLNLLKNLYTSAFVGLQKREMSTII